MRKNPEKVHKHTLYTFKSTAIEGLEADNTIS